MPDRVFLGLAIVCLLSLFAGSFYTARSNRPCQCDHQAVVDLREENAYLRRRVQDNQERIATFSKKIRDNNTRTVALDLLVSKLDARSGRRFYGGE